MQNITLNAELRTAVGGGRVKRLRKTGMVPAVLYGKGIEPIKVQVKMSDIRKLLITSGKNAFFSLLVDGKEHSAIIKEMQYETVSNNLIHIDLQQVSLTEKITSTVALRLIGRDEVEKGGQVLIHQMDVLDIQCLPQNIPSHIGVDVSKLEVGSNISVGELDIPENVDVLNDPGDVICSLTEARSVAEDEEEEVEAEGEAVESETEEAAEE